MIENDQLWNVVLNDIESVVSGNNYKVWLKQSSIAKQEDGIVFLSVPHIFAKNWFYDHLHKAILKTIRNKADYVRGIDYIIRPPELKKKDSVKPKKEESTAQIPLQDYYVNKDDNLNPRYTFDTFVVGPFNEIAHAAAQAVLKKPGSAYNPLFIYGDTGRGKTHLIQAVGNHIKILYPNKKVFYVTSEKFSNDFISAVQNNRAQLFKEKYRVYDVIIMDDIQFFSNKERSQEELFHLFNNFYDNNKQIIFSSDKHPHYIQNLEERLKSRFNAGMIIDIPAPDFESRMAILKAKSSMGNIDVKNDIIEFLAQNIEGNIRELEGILNSIVIHTQLKNRELSLNEVKNLIKGSSRPKKNVSVKDIIKTVADFYNIDEKIIYEKSRKKEVVKPRQMIMYLLREDYDISYPSIGDKLGGRDHTTVIHSCEKIKEDIKNNPSLLDEIERIRSMISC